MKYTAEEVRAMAKMVGDEFSPHAGSMLTAYAERIKASEGAAPRVTEMLVQAVHLYRGDCPDALQPESRDTECEACREEDALRAHLLSQEAEIERLQSRLAAANSLLREISDRTATGTDFRDLAVRIRAHLSEATP